MTITLLINVGRWIDEPVGEKLRDLAWIEGYRVKVPHVTDADWERIFEVLADAGIDRLKTPISFVHDEPDDWLSRLSSTEWIGAELSAFDLCRVGNPVNQLQPPEERKHDRIIVAEADVELIDQPDGDLVRAEAELVFTRQLVNWLGGDSSGTICGSVLLKGQRLPEWVRYEIGSHVRLLGTESLQPRRRCQICGEDFVSPCGVWIGQVEEDFRDQVAVDWLSYGHKDRVRSIVVSLSQAAKLRRHRRTNGFVLNPIYRPSSRTAETIRQIKLRAASLTTGA